MDKSVVLTGGLFSERLQTARPTTVPLGSERGGGGGGGGLIWPIYDDAKNLNNE